MNSLVKPISLTLRVFASALLLACSALLSQSPAQIPEVLWGGRDVQFPVFVAASRLVLPSGELDPTLLSDGDLIMLQRLLQQPVGEDGCVAIEWHTPVDGAQPKATTAVRVLRQSGNVLVGRVVDEISGFSGVQPGTLLRITVEDVLKGSSAPTILVFYPVADVLVRDVRLCQRNRNWAHRPEVGGEVLVVFDDNLLNESSGVIQVGPNGLFPLSNGRVGLPKLLREKNPEAEGIQVDELLAGAGMKSRVER